MTPSAHEREAQRQQALLASLRSRDAGRSLQALCLADGLQRGWQAYEANAGACAERALAETFPTVLALVGEESFAALARALWQAEPPQRGDLACFGAGLPAFVAASDQLADVPYLADCARLDALMTAAERAADETLDAASLQLLASEDPACIRLRTMPGMAVLESRHPVVTLRQAHDDRHFDAARQALAERRPENALVWRSGWRAQVQAVDAATARWMTSLMAGADLASALYAAGTDFMFETWFAQALQQGWLAGAQTIEGKLP